MNEFARTLNGKYPADPVYVLRHGRIITVRPITCVLTPLESTGSKPVVKTAVYNIGFGYSGEGSAILDKPDFQSKLSRHNPVKRWVKFVREGWDLQKNYPYFDITIDGERRKILDISATKGHSFYVYWRLPIRLSRPEFWLSMFESKSLPHTAKNLYGMATGQSFKGNALAAIEFILHEPVVGHVGGEVFTTPAPCKVEISLHERPVTMITTSPKA